jgi:ubiquinone/menaquinone biosynthesis C-methylase UbiE
MLDLPEEFKEIVGPDARKKYYSANPLKNRLLLNFIKRIFETIGEPGHGARTMLEIGCGDGIAGYLIKKKFKDIDYLGADIKKLDLMIASQILKGEKLVLLDGRKLPFKENGFEVVICLEVLEHVPDWEGLLKESLRVAKNQVIFSVPLYPYYQLSNFVFGKNLKRFGEHPDHINQFRINQLKSRVDRLLGSLEGKPKIKEFSLVTSFPWCIGRVNI